jgi:tetratricopeptide (TPR) repeat protein
MAVAQRLKEAGESEMVVRHLNQYLLLEPTDSDALALKAEAIVALAKEKNPGAILGAAQAQETLIRAAPESPEAQKARRRLVTLYTRYGDFLRENANTVITSQIALRESRYAAAERTARELMAGGADDPEAHRLLALALEGRAVPGDKQALNDAIHEFRTVLIEDPKDIIAASHLSALYRDRLKDTARADSILSELLQTLPDSIEVRLVRYRHFIESHRPDLAVQELEAAIKLSPNNVDVLLAATENAFRRGRIEQARAYLASVPEASRSELRVLMLRGMLDFGEEHPDEAIDSWRRCLTTSAGTDAETSWWLAYALIQIGRTADAKPLIYQYRRLAGLGSAKLRFLEAVLDEKTGRPARAIFMIDQIKERFEPRWEEMIQLTRGRCYEALWDEHKAAKYYTMAIENEPTSVVARLAQANLRLKRRPDEAILEIERGLAAIPKHPALKVALAGALLRREAALPRNTRSFVRFDRAWKDAMDTSPEAPSLILMQADRLNITGQDAAAVALLEKAAANNVKSAALAAALVEGLNRLGKHDRALAVAERVSKPNAAGDSAALRIARARALMGLYRGGEARLALVENIDFLPASERPEIYIALGRLESGRGDPDAARRAYTEWAKLVPDDPRPRLVLLELALEQGDLTAAHGRVEELRVLGDSTASLARGENARLMSGNSDLAYRLGRIKELIAEHDDPEPSERTSDHPLQEARTLVDAVLLDAPALPAAQMAQAQVLERQGNLDEAVASYERAWENGIEAALPRIVELLTRRGRFDALAKLRNSPVAAGSAARLDLLSAKMFEKVGDRIQAGQLANQVAAELPDSTQALGWQVRMLDHLGKLDDAESALLAMADRRPDELTPLLRLLEFQAKHHRDAGADLTVARIKERFRSSKPERLDALIARTRGNYEGAARAYTAALDRDPNDVALLLEVAAFHEATGRSIEAEAAYRKVLELDPRNRPAARQLAAVLANRLNPTDWAKAWEVLGPESEANNEPDDRLARAMVLSKSSEPARKAEALREVDRLLGDLPASLPTAVEARKLFTNLLLEAGKTERAKQVSAISAADGTDPGAIALYAQALIQSKNPVAAEWQLDRLSTISPGDLRETSLRAKLIWDRSRPLEAAAALERAYQVRENTPGAESLGREAFLLLAAMGHETNDIAERLARSLAKKKPSWSWMPATILARKGQRDEALVLLNVAVSASKSRPTAEDLREVGRCAMQLAVASDDPVTLGKVAEILTKTLSLEPNSDELLVMTAMLRHLQRNYEEEVRLYKSVLTRRPESYVVLMNLAWALSEGLHRPDEAMPYMETLDKVAKGDIAAMDTHAVILMRSGRLEQAIDELRLVVESKPIALHYFHQALAYKRAGRTEEARRCLEDARKAGLNVREVDVAERDDFQELVEPLTVGESKSGT